MPRSTLLRLRISFFAAFFTLLALATSASAGQALMGELPDGHNTVIAVDFTELRDSPLYKEGLEMLQSQPGATDALQQMEEELGVDIQSDISALVIASDSPPLSSQMVADPMAALEDPAPQQSAGAVILVRGDFDVSQLMAQIADTEEEADPPAYVRQGGMEIRSLDAQTVAILVGQEEYLEETAQRLQSGSAGPGAAFDRGVERLGGSQGLYMMTRPSIPDPEAVRDELGAVASFGGLAIDLSEEIRISGLLALGSEEEAAKMVEQVDEVRQEVAGNPLAALFGVGPLFDNLSVRQDDDELLVRTSMTNREASRLISRLGSLVESQQQLQNPLQGPGFGGDGEADDDDESSK